VEPPVSGCSNADLLQATTDLTDHTTHDIVTHGGIMRGLSGFLGSGLFKLLAVGFFVAAVAAVLLLFAPWQGEGEVSITMWTSGEKMNYLKDMVVQFNKEGHTIPGSKKKILLEAYTVNSGTMSEHLVNKIRDGIDFPAGVTPPHIVSPSVDHWLTRVNYLTGVEVFDLKNTKPLALTPVVIATYEEMARALGWPQKELGWTDIIELANNPQGWAAYPAAKVEWGKAPLLAWTDPTVSSTARSALFATFVAASGKPAEELLIEDVRNPEVRRYVEDLQESVDHYFPETLKLQTKLFLGPRFIHFAPLEEYILPWMKLGLVTPNPFPVGRPRPSPWTNGWWRSIPKRGRSGTTIRALSFRTFPGPAQSTRQQPGCWWSTCWSQRNRPRRWNGVSVRPIPTCPLGHI
jgi:hypothetical protein